MRSIYRQSCIVGMAVFWLMPSAGSAQGDGKIKPAFPVEDAAWVKRDDRPRHGTKLKIDRADGPLEGIFVWADDDETWHVRARPGQKPTAVTKAQRKKVDFLIAPVDRDPILKAEIHSQVVWNTYPEVHYSSNVVSREERSRLADIEKAENDLEQLQDMMRAKMGLLQTQQQILQTKLEMLRTEQALLQEEYRTQQWVNFNLALNNPLARSFYDRRGRDRDRDDLIVLSSFVGAPARHGPSVVESLPAVDATAFAKATPEALAEARANLRKAREGAVFEDGRLIAVAVAP